MTPAGHPQLSSDLHTLLIQVHGLLGAHATHAYLAGGLLRDVLLGRPPRDIDLALQGETAAAGRTLAAGLGGHFFLMSEARGQARVVLPDARLHIDLQPLEGDIAANLLRRDFTIDAIGASLDSALAGGLELIDPSGGLADLEQGTVRAVSEAAFRQDALRPLRGVRLATELGFSLDPGTALMMRKHASRVGEASAERRRNELVRILDCDQSGAGLQLLDSVGLLETLLPETGEMRGVSQPKEHYWDVFHHSLETVAALDGLLSAGPPSQEPARILWAELWSELRWLAPEARIYLDTEPVLGHSRRALLKLGGLLHDIAKPETKTIDETGRIRFFGHPEVGAETASLILGRLRFSGREIAFVRAMVDAHLRPVQLGQSGPPSRRAIYRLFRDCGEATLAVMLLSLADHLASAGPRLNFQGWRQHVRLIHYMLSERERDTSIVSPPRLIGGDDLITQLKLEPGPLLGHLLGAVREAQAAGEVRTKEEALGLARQELARVKADATG